MIEMNDFALDQIEKIEKFIHAQNDIRMAFRLSRSFQTCMARIQRPTMYTQYKHAFAVKCRLYRGSGNLELAFELLFVDAETQEEYMWYMGRIDIFGDEFFTFGWDAAFEQPWRN